MPKRRKWTFALLAGSLIVGAIWFALSDRQPSYQGKPLAYWLCLKNNDADDAVRDEPHFEEAIRAMGTNCLPFLLKWIAYEPPDWKTKLIDFLILKGPKWIPERLQEDRAARLAGGAEDAFRVLGYRASPAVPDLVRLAKDGARGMSAYRAVNGLVSIGLEARPIFIDLLKNPRPDIRTGGIFGLSALGTNASPAIPQLILCLKDPDERVALSAALALGYLHLRPKLSVPALTNALRDGRERVESEAVAALCELGPKGQAVVMELLNHPSPSLQNLAISKVARFGTNALPAIPRLITLLKGPDESIAARSAFALGELQLQPESSVPALTNALQDGSCDIALAAHTALVKFGLVFPAVPSPQNIPGLFRERYGLSRDTRYAPRSPTNVAPVRAE